MSSYYYCPTAAELKGSAGPRRQRAGDGLRKAKRPPDPPPLLAAGGPPPRPSPGPAAPSPAAGSRCSRPGGARGSGHCSRGPRTWREGRSRALTARLPSLSPRRGLLCPPARPAAGKRERERSERETGAVRGEMGNGRVREAREVGGRGLGRGRGRPRPPRAPPRSRPR